MVLVKAGYHLRYNINNIILSDKASAPLVIYIWDSVTVHYREGYLRRGVSANEWGSDAARDHDVGYASRYKTASAPCSYGANLMFSRFIAAVRLVISRSETYILLGSLQNLCGRIGSP